jgi:putative transposase
MPRKPRFQLPGVPQHVIQRGNNREPCFYAPADYHRYLDNLKQALQVNQCDLHAYVLMTNHVHLLITPQAEHGIAHTMQDTGRKFVHYMNRTYRRSGTLWEGRYKTSLVDSEAYLLTCMRYIEMNPVRAGMVEHPGEYHWSSYAANAQGKANPIVCPHPQYVQLGREASERQLAYRDLFQHSLDTTQLHQLREALNQELVLGREEFKDKIERLSRRQVRRGKDGRPRVEDIMGEYDVVGFGILEKTGI